MEMNIELVEMRRRLIQIQQKIHFTVEVVEWKYGNRIDNVFEKKDKAMYEAKTIGKNDIGVK